MRKNKKFNATSSREKKRNSLCEESRRLVFNILKLLLSSLVVRTSTLRRTSSGGSGGIGEVQPAGKASVSIKTNMVTSMKTLPVMKPQKPKKPVGCSGGYMASGIENGNNNNNNNNIEDIFSDYIERVRARLVDGGDNGSVGTTGSNDLTYIGIVPPPKHKAKPAPIV